VIRVRNVAKKEDRTYKGVVYDSKSEMLRAFELDALKAAGKILDWERQWPFTLAVNGITICKFVVDFRVRETPGNVYYEEVKGWETPEYKLKLKLFKAIYQNVDYRIIKA
jgi:hypothetical protein